MKNITLLLFLITIVTTLSNSCEITVNGTNPGDDEKEIKNGFSYESLDFTIHGLHPVKKNEVPLGSDLFFEFSGVQGATEKDGFKHVGMAILITDEQGEVLAESEDLLSNIEQQDLDLDYYYAHYDLPSSMKDGDEFTVKLNLFDKYGDVSYEVEETFYCSNARVPGTEGVKIKAVQATSENEVSVKILKDDFQEETAPVDVYQEETLYMYLDGLSGFVASEGMINIHYLIELFDEKGDRIFDLEEDLIEPMGDMETYPIYFNQDFGHLAAGSYEWKVTLHDNNGTDMVTISVPVKMN